MYWAWALKNNKAIDLVLFEYRKWRHQIPVILLDCHYITSGAGDHSPHFSFELEILGLKLIEFNWYDTRHQQHEDEFCGDRPDLGTIQYGGTYLWDGKFVSNTRLLATDWQCKHCLRWNTIHAEYCQTLGCGYKHENIE